MDIKRERSSSKKNGFMGVKIGTIEKMAAIKIHLTLQLKSRRFHAIPIAIGTQRTRKEMATLALNLITLVETFPNEKYLIKKVSSE